MTISKHAYHDLPANQAKVLELAQQFSWAESPAHACLHLESVILDLQTELVDPSLLTALETLIDLCQQAETMGAEDLTLYLERYEHCYSTQKMAREKRLFASRRGRIPGNLQENAPGLGTRAPATGGLGQKVSGKTDWRKA